MSEKVRDRRLNRYTHEQKVKIIEDYLQSKLSVKNYSEKSGVNSGSLHRWLREFNQRSNYIHKRFSPEQRKEAVEAFLKSGLTQRDFSKTWGIDQKTLCQWFKIYRENGPQSLVEGQIYPSTEAPKKRGRRGASQKLKDKIVEVKKGLPEYGLKKLRDVLSRFEGISVAPNTIKKILVENDLFEPPKVPPKKDLKPHVKRFERANPMQLWQSDITSFVLKRTCQRVYLVVFKDDHSRFVVSWALALQQTGNFVIECLLDGVQKYGLPQEILTDQGRQYFSWRGKSEFQKVLAREGIQHVVARSHHPQTLGKCERLWKTIGIEFWERAKPQDLDEAKDRLTHYFNHYNHFRPHQGIDGMTPADRFFGVENELRAVFEEAMSENELRLSLDQAPRKPLYFVGQIGEQKLTMHGEKGEIIINTPDGETQRMNYDEFGREPERTTNTEEERKAWAQERELSRSEDASSSEGALGVSDGSGARESTLASDHNYGILDGHNHEARSSEEARSTNSSSLADGSDGASWNVHGTTQTTKEGGYDRQRERSEGTQEENQGTGANYRNSESTDRDLEISSGRWDVRQRKETFSRTEGGEGSSRSGDTGQEKRSEKWQEAKEDPSVDTLKKLKEKWQNSWLKKDEE